MKFTLNKTEASRLTRNAYVFNHVRLAKRASLDSVPMAKFAVVNILLQLICSGQDYAWRASRDEFQLFVKTPRYWPSD
jgi:hypothetical protein